MPAAVPPPAAHSPVPGVTRRPRKASGGFRRVLRRTTVLPLTAVGVLALALVPQAALAGGPSYVALGDSYTSGPLIPNPTGTPLGCLRSTDDYPQLTASAIGASSFTNISCAGATTANMNASQSVTGGTNPPQFSAINSGTTVVTMGIGGNDIGFTSIIETCAEDSLSNPLGSPCKNQYDPNGNNELAQDITNLAPTIGSLIQQIHSIASGARVFVVGYPVILPNTGDGCWPVVPIAYGDVPYLRSVELDLNSMLSTEASENGATYVNTYTDSIGHDACQATGTKWVEGLVPTSPAAPFHPNELGEEHMADQVEAAIG
jgi:lysophospholipase L1-like esterase